MADIHIQINDLATAKVAAACATPHLLTAPQKELEEVEKVLESILHVGAPHAAFYRVSSDYFKVAWRHTSSSTMTCLQRTGEFGAFYENSLKYLGCIELRDVSCLRPRRAAGH